MAKALPYLYLTMVLASVLSSRLTAVKLHQNQKLFLRHDTIVKYEQL